MILTDDFVFIHEPKTGGTFVTEMLRSIYELVTDHSVIKRVLRRMHRRGKKPVLNILKHGTCSEIPNSHRDKPILATIRNPYDRYVSQYEFAWWKVPPEDYCDVEELRKRYPHYPNLTFEEFIELNNTLFLRLKNDRFLGIDPFKNGDPPPMLSARIEAEKMHHSHDTPARNFFLTRTANRVKKVARKVLRVLS